MAERDKTEHISESIMERFCMRALTESELTMVARHLNECPDCQAEFVSALRLQREGSELSFTLAPEFWLRHEHLEYDQLMKLGDDKSETADRELIDAHLKVCPTCREDIQSFLAFREQIAPEMSVSYASMEREPTRGRLSWVGWWRSLVWKPIYSAAIVVIGIALVIGGAFLLSRRGEDQQVQQVPSPNASPSATPQEQLVNLPSPAASPGELPSPAGAESLVVLNDRGGTITVYKSGNVSGLDDVPASTRNEIAQVLLSGRIDRPPVLKELGGQDSALRGSNRGQPFKLIEPRRSVIVSNQPTFRWESIPGASSYTVYVNDGSGRVTAKSDGLTPDRRDWVPTPLKRGEIYTWTVMAVVDGKEIVSPGSSAPEMKFQVLSASHLEQLRELMRVRSHLALGLFYAKVGSIAEAERELQAVVRQNPNSESATRLLRRIRSWQSR